MGRRRTASLVAGIVLSPLGLVPAPATAHPSDFATLTLDLLIGPDSLEAIDAAVVESAGPIYQPFPTSELKHAVATDVLEALHVPLDQVDIDAETSERYHEVGFLVRFHEPSLGTAAPLSIDTTDLQLIAADSDTSRLKLSVCGITAGNKGPSQSTLSRLDIQASQPGQPPATPYPEMTGRRAASGHSAQPTSPFQSRSTPGRADRRGGGGTHAGTPGGARRGHWLPRWLPTP